jgi:hypothetical protein
LPLDGDADVDAEEAGEYRGGEFSHPRIRQGSPKLPAIPRPAPSPMEAAILKALHWCRRLGYSPLRAHAPPGVGVHQRRRYAGPPTRWEAESPGEFHALRGNRGEGWRLVMRQG